MNTDDQDGKINERRNKIITKVLETLKGDIYYSPTMDIANLIKDKIENSDLLNRDDLALVENLSAEDIQIFLSYKDNSKFNEK